MAIVMVAKFLRDEYRVLPKFDKENKKDSDV